MDDLQDLLTESITDQSHVISADEAIQLARTELKSIPSSFTERSRSQRNYENASVSVVSSNEAPLYIVNFENGGKNAVQGFKNFGYHTPYESAFTFEIAREELEAEYPILAMGTNSSTGKCHAWVIDGLYCEEVTCTYRRVDNNAPCTSYIYTESEFLHCNWGWGGFQNTFVRPNLFIGYDTNIRIYTNIY